VKYTTLLAETCPVAVNPEVEAAPDIYPKAKLEGLGNNPQYTVAEYDPPKAKVNKVPVPLPPEPVVRTICPE